MDDMILYMNLWMDVCVRASFNNHRTGRGYHGTISHVI